MSKAKQIKMIVAENLAKKRKEAGLTQTSLAKQIGVKHNTISSWESGTNSIDIESIIKICEVLGITLNDMYQSQNDDFESEDTILIGGIDENGDFVNEFPNEEALKTIRDLAGLPLESSGDLKLMLEILHYKYNKKETDKSGKKDKLL